MLLLSTLLSALFLPTLTRAFSFSLGSDKPTQCGTVQINWSGGQAPFSLVIIPVFDYPSTVSIPASNYDSSSGTGSYTWTVNYPPNTRFVAMMSDGTGTGTGGVSPLYTVGSGTTSSCSLRTTDTDFLFYLNQTSVTQCAPVEIYWDQSAVTPVSIIGAIPGGQAFQLVSTNSKTSSLVWDTNIASNTNIILAAFDSGSHGQGGTSDLMKIGGSNDNSCIDDASPSSTTAGAVETGTRTSGGGGVKTVTAITTETTVPKGAAGLSTGAIVGIVVSAVVTVVALQMVLFWFCCRRQVKSLIYHRREMRGQEVKPGGEVDLGLASRHSTTLDDPYASLSPSGRPYSIARTRSVGDELDAASDISPFWDGAAMRTSGSISGLPTLPTIRTEDSSWDLEPPRAPHSQTHGRHDSYASMGNSIAETYAEGSPSSPSPSTFSPTSPLVGYRPPPSSSTRSTLTKAQMAAALSAHNPDPSPSGSQFGERLPPQEAPSGGFRRHEDAGRLGDEPQEREEQSVEDLPPLYKPEWETDNHRRSGTGGGGGEGTS
ncbi:hypothetical protein CI109_105621 [Kwoniella shandongensis]|uniref:Uncharacterized protein n=1 Tax=Kwoniella shandongensis TaxID=1734106 RepID=A0A5M6C335_9TREE|nr:uncharacterized protein CI109_002337 [Kwoniella shandongensis]KAA5529444.1 hypothetical protein CI109_002337 [Kwoniella shandongensis]